MAKRNKLFPFIIIMIFLGLGIFVGALIASPQYRHSVFDRVNESRPVTFINKYLTEKKIEYVLDLPTGKDHPALRRKQNR